MTAPLSPWTLARSADGFVRAVHADPRSVAGRTGLVTVGAGALTRAGAVLVAAGVLVMLTRTSWDLVVVLIGAAGPVGYVLLYLGASTRTARDALTASLRRGYRTSLALGVLAAGVLVRYVGVRHGWVDAPPPTAPWLLPLLVLAAVRAQAAVLRRRVRRGR